MMCELSAAKRRADRLEVKIKKIKELIEKATKQGATTLEVRNVGKKKSRQSHIVAQFGS